MDVLKSIDLLQGIVDSLVRYCMISKNDLPFLPGEKVSVHRHSDSIPQHISFISKIGKIMPNNDTQNTDTFKYVVGELYPLDMDALDR